MAGLFIALGIALLALVVLLVWYVPRLLRAQGTNVEQRLAHLETQVSILQAELRRLREEQAHLKE